MILGLFLVKKADPLKNISRSSRAPEKQLERLGALRMFPFLTDFWCFASYAPKDWSLLIQAWHDLVELKTSLIFQNGYTPQHLTKVLIVVSSCPSVCFVL